MAGATATDPISKLSVRPTDNGAKEDDFYPSDQTPKMMFTGPDGSPYRDLSPVEDSDSKDEGLA